jgi:imidazolonepropionase-like amidohydrolase
MSPMQAIVAATSVSSQLCGVGDRLGTVEVGKLADLVVCEGDPLADISVLEHADNIKLVVQSGRIVKDNLPVQPRGRDAVSGIGDTRKA